MARGDQLGCRWRLIQLLARPQGRAIADASCELACVRTPWRDRRVLQDADFPEEIDAALGLGVAAQQVVAHLERPLGGERAVDRDQVLGRADLELAPMSLSTRVVAT